MTNVVTEYNFTECPREIRPNCTYRSRNIFHCSGNPRPNEGVLPGWESFDKIIMDFMREYSIPGISLAVAQHGEMLYKQCYGLAGPDTLLRSHHLFRIASVTKVLTAIAVMKLFEDNALQLNDKIFGSKGILREYSPTAAGDRRLLRVTVKHLLQHSGGWDRDVVGDPCFWTHVAADMDIPGPVDQQQLITYMMSQKLQFTPGTKYAYSNFGYVVLGRVIERLSGTSYETYVQSLLRRLGITKMRLGKTRKQCAFPEEVEYFAGPEYLFVDSVFPGEGKVPSPYGGYAMEAGDSDGGWIANPSDLLLVLHSLEQKSTKERILKPQTVKMMLAKPSYAKGSIWYGFGLDVAWYGKAWEHGGHIDGATSSLTREKSGFTWAVLCNYWPADSDYTSLVSYALNRVTQLKRPQMDCMQNADASSKDCKYLVKLRVPNKHLEPLNVFFRSKGYSALWVGGYQFQGESFFNIIWSKAVHSSYLFFNISSSELEMKIQWTKKSHMIPVFLDSYKLGSEVKYCLIVKKVSDAFTWDIYINLITDDLSAKCKDVKDNGLILKQLSCENVDGVDTFTAMFVEDSNPSWWKSSLDSEAYQKSCDRQAHYGHMPSHVKVYRLGKEPRFCAVWSNPGPYRYTSEHDLSKYRLLNDIALTSETGFYPLCIAGYEDEHDHKFAAVCVKKV